MQRVQGRGFDGPVSSAFQSFLHSSPENVLKHQLKQSQKTAILDVQYSPSLSDVPLFVRLLSRHLSSTFILIIHPG